jgi:hypothetical protein
MASISPGYPLWRLRFPQMPSAVARPCCIECPSEVDGSTRFIRCSECRDRRRNGDHLRADVYVKGPRTPRADPQVTEKLLQLLEEARRRGEEFSDIWPSAMREASEEARSRPEARLWRTALAETSDSWCESYQGIGSPLRIFALDAPVTW